MPNHLLVVEGAHDAAFFGRLLARRAFEPVMLISAIPEDWAGLVPQKYPFSKAGRLERVVICPEFWIRADTGDVCAVSVAGGDGELLARTRDGLDQIRGGPLASIGIVLDADYEHSAEDRFALFANKLGPWNDKGVAEFSSAFPLPVPDGPGVVVTADIRFGIHQLPGLAQQGTLETILLACADSTHPALKAEADKFLDAAHAQYDLDDLAVRKSRSVSGRAKAACGVIANVMMPGSSLAVALRNGSWLPDDEATIPFVSEAAEFLDALLRPKIL